MKTDLRQTVSINLRFPVTVDGLNHESLTIRRPKTRDVVAAAKAPGVPLERELFLLARLCDVSPDVIEELDETDASTLADQLEAFRRK